VLGEIGAAGETRRMLLQALLPSLTIGKVARIDGRFLRVQGKRRAYKIHLGSGNILMEPNDQYLCIVPKSDVAGAKVSLRLPFEGDTVLSIILSKAAMLAADDKISDQTILSQIGR
jgi:2-hydroxy-3-keto-5-methylthiopentenyl-1-phosphate phosphatase